MTLLKLKLVTNKENIYPNQFFRFADRTRSERTQPETVSVKKEESDAANVLQPKSGGRLESTSTIRCGCTVYQSINQSINQFLYWWHRQTQWQYTELHCKCKLIDKKLNTKAFKNRLDMFWEEDIWAFKASASPLIIVQVQVHVVQNKVPFGMDFRVVPSSMHCLRQGPRSPGKGKFGGRNPSSPHCRLMPNYVGSCL